MMSNRTITELNLADNLIGDTAVLFADVIQINTHLRLLNLSNNGIGDASAPNLTEALKFNRTLIEFYLDGNNFSTKGESAFDTVIRFSDTEFVY